MGGKRKWIPSKDHDVNFYLNHKKEILDDFVDTLKFSLFIGAVGKIMNRNWIHEIIMLIAKRKGIWNERKMARWQRIEGNTNTSNTKDIFVRFLSYLPSPKRTYLWYICLLEIPSYLDLISTADIGCTSRFVRPFDKAVHGRNRFHPLISTDNWGSTAPKRTCPFFPSRFHYSSIDLLTNIYKSISPTRSCFWSTLSIVYFCFIPAGINGP